MTRMACENKPCPVAIAARPGRHAVLGHYRGDEYPHKILVSSIGDEIRGTIKNTAGDGSSIVVAVSGDDRKTTDQTVSLKGAAEYWLNGIRSTKADALRRGLDIVVYPERGRKSFNSDLSTLIFRLNLSP
jgi:hypothetical protein